MFWSKKPDGSSDGKSDEKKAATAAAAAAVAVDKSSPPAFDPKKLPQHEKLPPSLQSKLDKADKDDNFYDEIVSGYAPESTESNVRYAAYASRLRTILLSAHRYVAYTSDVGESFRPVAHPKLVRGAYAVSWLYLVGDVSHEGYKAYLQNQRTLHPEVELTERQKRIAHIKPGDTAAPAVPGVVTPLEDYRTVIVQRAIFQGIASMGLPAFTIHSVVRYSGQALKNVKNKTMRTWGPIGLGLAVVPFLPRLFDEPVENAVEYVFHRGFEAFGGKAAIGNTPSTQREKQLAQNKKVPEKEL